MWDGSMHSETLKFIEIRRIELIFVFIDHKTFGYKRRISQLILPFLKLTSIENKLYHEIKKNFFNGKRSLVISSRRSHSFDNVRTSLGTSIASSSSRDFHLSVEERSPRLWMKKKHREGCGNSREKNHDKNYFYEWKRT